MGKTTVLLIAAFVCSACTLALQIRHQWPDGSITELKSKREYPQGFKFVFNPASHEVLFESKEVKTDDAALQAWALGLQALMRVTP